MSGWLAEMWSGSEGLGASRSKKHRSFLTHELSINGAVLWVSFSISKNMSNHDFELSIHWPDFDSPINPKIYFWAKAYWGKTLIEQGTTACHICYAQDWLAKAWPTTIHMLTLQKTRIEHLMHARHPGSLESSPGLPSGLICLTFAHGSCGMAEVTTGPHRYSGHHGLNVGCATRNVPALVEIHPDISWWPFILIWR